MKIITRLPALPKWELDANKGDRGKVVIVAGSRGMAGAPCLAARGACRGGAGLVRVAVPLSIWDIAAIKLDECLTEGLPETQEGSVALSAHKEIEKLSAWADVVVMGPGMSQHLSTATLIQRVFSDIAKPFVLDADALNAFQGHIASIGAAQQKFPQRPVVLTPHPGEMARLLGITIAEVQSHREDAVRQAAQSAHAVSILKGAGTLVCDGKRIYKNTTGNPGMATGGTGDVLSGLIGALIGQGMEAFDAACLGVHLHGLAGDLAAKAKGCSMTAGDLVEHLPAALSAETK